MWDAVKYLGTFTGDFGADVISRRGCLLLQVTFFSLLAQVRMRYSSRDGRGQQNEFCVVELLILNTTG